MAVIRRPAQRAADRALARRRRRCQQWYIDRALEHVALVGRLTATRRRWLADRLKVSERQARRLVAQGGYRQRSRLKVEGARLDALWDARGNIAMAAETLDVPRSTLADNVLLDVSAAEIGRMRKEGGERAQRNVELNLPQVHVFGSCWQFDVKQVSTSVRCPVTDEEIRPYVGHTKCPASKVLLGAWPLPRRFKAADIVDAIKHAMEIRSAEGPFGGTPVAIRWDNAGEHLPKEVAEFLDSYDIAVDHIPDYRPDANGSVESFHAFVETRYAAATRYYTDRPKKRNKDPELAVGDDVPTWAEFCDGYAQFIFDYNHRHRHKSIGGKTPAERWRELSTGQKKQGDDDLPEAG